MSDYTLEWQLCDEEGIVTGPYLDHINHLRTYTQPFGEHKPVTKEFPCTGSAHLAGEHIRCTSPAHALQSWSVLDQMLRSGSPIMIGNDTFTMETKNDRNTYTVQTSEVES